MSSLLAKITLICAGIVCVVLGAHGLYIYCYFRVASFLGTHTTDVSMASSSLSTQEYLSRLFLAWDVPNQIRNVVLWVTVKGLESWVVPTVIIVAGMLLLRVQKVCKVHA